MIYTVRALLNMEWCNKICSLRLCRLVWHVGVRTALFLLHYQQALWHAGGADKRDRSVPTKKAQEKQLKA